MAKRNEQAAWQRRYCALVPHTFLYYYDSEIAESPRGVIDIECYTDVKADASYTIKVRYQTFKCTTSRIVSSTPMLQ
jgi:hypothetical protein